MKRSWQSYLINAILRLTVKKRLPLDAGLENMCNKFTKIDARLSKPPADLSIDHLNMGPVQGERLRTSGSRDDRVLYYLHGGGFAMGIFGSHREMVASWCTSMSCVAFLPDYRLTPQHPFPAAPEDCMAGYRWLLEQNIDARNIVVAGDSAGGCLSLALIQDIRDAGLPLPAAAILLSPAADLTMSGESILFNERKDPMFHLQALLMMRNAYVSEQQISDPLASPLFGDFAGLPPLKILVGSTEMLLSDAQRVAQRAKDASIDVQLDVWQGMPHVFPVIRMLPESELALKEIRHWLDQHSVWMHS